MWGRIVDDLNRPDLISQAQDYAKDAIRYFQRKPFFFNDTDNTLVPPWIADLYYTQGATIQVNVGGTQTAFVALNAGLAGAVQPTWPATQFSNPTPPAFPPPAIGTPGTVQDNQILWANNGPYQQGATTSFSTVYQINQYVMPLDLIALNLVEVNWQGNIRIKLIEITYEQLRSYDVIRPFAPASYPSWFAWYQQQVYLWPYPAGLYPITLSYRSAPPIPVLPITSNIWTTQAEACVRYYAEGLMNLNLMHDQSAAKDCFELSVVEYNQLVTQAAQQQQQQGVSASDW